MKHTKKLVTLFFATILLIGTMVIVASAQRRGKVRIYRPVAVGSYYYGYSNPWYWNSWANPWYGDPSFYDPYYRERQQRSYLNRRVRGDRKDLRKSIEKYNADGVLTDKERRKLEDKYQDVEKSERKLREFNEDNGDE